MCRRQSKSTTDFSINVASTFYCVWLWNLGVAQTPDRSCRVNLKVNATPQHMALWLIIKGPMHKSCWNGPYWCWTTENNRLRSEPCLPSAAFCLSKSHISITIRIIALFDGRGDLHALGVVRGEHLSCHSACGAASPILNYFIVPSELPQRTTYEHGVSQSSLYSQNDALF